VTHLREICGSLILLGTNANFFGVRQDAGAQSQPHWAEAGIANAKQTNAERTYLNIDHLSKSLIESFAEHCHAQMLFNASVLLAVRLVVQVVCFD